MMRLKKLLTALLAFMLCVCAPAHAEYDMPYYIGVDLTNQIVTVYRTEDDAIVRQMLTSTGINDSTPEGTFYMEPKGRLSERGEWTWLRQYQCWVKFASRIYHGYMFHSLPFEEKDESTMIEQSVKEFGMPASHGCMRLRVDDARFIAKECLQGTKVVIYKNEVKEEELRELLLISSYNSEEGLTYSEFLGYSEDDLSRGSTGTEVSDLQHRLIDLGYYDGEAHGRYDNDTIAAVKNVQQDLGVARSGIASRELLEVLYSEDAPVSAGQATLTEGRSGPVVKRLQSALRTLGVYGGELDSVYDLEVSEALRLFQGACGYDVDGVATPELQQAVYYQLNRLEEVFGAESVPQAEIVREEISMARLESKANIIIREKPDTDSDNLGKLRNGDSVMLDGVEGSWAAISVGSVNGYVLKKYLQPYTQDNVILKYTGAGGETYQIGHTMAEYRAGAGSFAEEFSAIRASGEFAGVAAEPVNYVTIATGSDDVRLNLRAAPDSGADVLAELPNGTSLRVLSRENGWTKVGYDEQIGYLMDDYLSFWEGSVDDVESTEAPRESAAAQLELEEDGEAIQAVVVCTGADDKANVYEAGSEDAKVLGSLPAGTQVEVVEVAAEDDWVRIRYREREGYMLDANLQFQLM